MSNNSGSLSINGEYKEAILSYVEPIRDDLLSGAAELALRAIVMYQNILNMAGHEPLDKIKEILVYTSRTLVNAQPAMAPLFHLANNVLLATDKSETVEALLKDAQETLDQFEKTLCASAAKIADITFDIIEPGGLIFAYSFSSTVVSCLLNARAKGRFFRVVTTEARPSLEGRKLAARLASGGIEVIHTFDNALGLVLGNCCAAFMGCDLIGNAGVVNKVGSWVLAVACREMNVPLYAISGTEKFVAEDRMFEFENHERPGCEVWPDSPKGVAVLNHQFDLVPFSLLAGLVTEKGILREKDIQPYVDAITVHQALSLEPAIA